MDLLSESLFEVNKDSGVITTLKTLDYEDIKQHVLFIQAEDNGASKLSGKRRKVIVSSSLPSAVSSSS